MQPQRTKRTDLAKPSEPEDGPLTRDFSDLCRQFRRERGLLLRDQAEAFDCSVSYLSAIETGRKGTVPERYIDKFIAWLRLEKKYANDLRHAAALSATKVVLNITTREQAHIAAFLGRAIETMTNEELKNIREKVLDLRPSLKDR